MQVALHVDLTRRVPLEVETAVYFCCVEALQNVAKHCSADTHAELALFEAPDGLHFSLADPGPGSTRRSWPTLTGSPACATGWRRSAAGLTLRSRPGRGCRVSGVIPLDAD